MERCAELARVTAGCEGTVAGSIHRLMLDQVAHLIPADESHHMLPPGGEPIKVGQRSQRRHEEALERAWTTMGKAIEAEHAATEAAAAAARATSARYSPVTVANRIRGSGPGEADVVSWMSR